MNWARAPDWGPSLFDRPHLTAGPNQGFLLRIARLSARSDRIEQAAVVPTSGPMAWRKVRSQASEFVPECFGTR